MSGVRPRAKTKKQQFGELPPRYRFVLNPYPDARLSRCFRCARKTGQRKIPLLIHVEPMHLIALNYTCRYCGPCDLLIAHKDEIEHLLSELFCQYDPEVVGNDYLIIGTVKKPTWREGLQRPKLPAEMLGDVADFAEHHGELRLTAAGWHKADQEPPVLEPPPSQEWVKA